jgi:hypothetical protein
MLEQINVGDFVEVEGDCGSITNAPWMNKVVKIEGGLFYFNEGTSKTPYIVGYILKESNFRVIGRNPYADNAKVFIFTH